jgi:HK97 gp10 family phage protein
MIAIELKGFKELTDKLAEFENKVAKKIAFTAVAHAAVPIRDTAKELCPVSEDGSHGNPPGYLRDSLVIHTHSQKGVIRAKVESRKGAFEPGKYYGGYLEYGTNKMAARPFLRPAIDANKQQCLDLLAEELRKGIEGQHAFEAGQAVGEQE